jgi:hypothetical protein
MHMRKWRRPARPGPGKPAAETPLPSYREFKVVRIYRLWTHTKAHALEAVREEGGNFFLVTEFAVEERPKGWAAALLKQLFG